MKLSDYVAQFVTALQVKQVFLISGGGMMHLLDSFGKQPLELICNLNEQATAICADSVGQYTKNIGVCLVTTGPGGTNAMTGVAAAFLDSTPVLMISGQCKTADSAKLRGVRQFGAQEVDVVAMATPITKYAVTVTDPTTIRYELEQAVYLAKEGRQGPVWVDIPLDVQGTDIDPASLQGFTPSTDAPKALAQTLLQTQVAEVFSLLQEAKRPLFLIGGGAVCDGREALQALLQTLQVPVLTTWRAKDLLHETHPLYVGMPGAPAYRYSNNILQNCDLLVVLGSRLNVTLTIYDEAHFATQAKKVVVDIDEQELGKLSMKDALLIKQDATAFVEALTAIATPIATDPRWMAYCNEQKAKYPLCNERQPLDNEGKVDGYYLAEVLSHHAKESDQYVGSSSGRTCGISHMGIFLKEGQRFVSSMGLGSMGFTVPSAIACCLAGGKRRTIALEGDGSLQHNIQELQLIQNYHLPIKLFVLSNEGYASIYMMQKNNFEERYVASHYQNGVAFPKMADVAKAYGLDYHCIETDDEVESVVQQVLCDDRPTLCEVRSSIYFDEIPKSMTVAHANGTFSSSALENLYPFLPAEEVCENMIKWD